MTTLRGWNAIAAHLGVSARTAQRWERTLGLPVTRTTSPGGEIVEATSDALSRWLHETAVTRRGDDPSGPLTDPPNPPASPAPATAPPAVSAASVDRPLMCPPLAYSRRVLLTAVASSALVSAVVGSFVGRLTVAHVPVASAIVSPGSPSSNIVGDTRGQLVGRLIVDTNGNGEWDAGELFIAEPGRDCPHTMFAEGFVVRWEGPARGSSLAMNCNPEPFYHGRLPEGRYHVTLDVPPGWQITSRANVQVDIEPGRDTHLWFAVRQTGP